MCEITKVDLKIFVTDKTSMSCHTTMIHSATLRDNRSQEWRKNHNYLSASKLFEINVSYFEVITEVFIGILSIINRYSVEETFISTLLLM